MIGPDVASVRGRVGGRLVYAVRIGQFTLQRAQTLSTFEGGVPPDVTWWLANHQGNLVEVYTTDPAWFVELERKIEDARRPR